VLATQAALTALGAPAAARLAVVAAVGSVAAVVLTAQRALELPSELNVVLRALPRRAPV
jgi:hypothetical protein